MTFNITIGPSPHGSDHSSFSEDEDSSGVQVSPPSDSGIHDYQDPYDEWAHLPYPDELKRSDSASRPRTSHRTRRNLIQDSSSGRLVAVEYSQDPTGQRQRRRPSPSSPESYQSSVEVVEDSSSIELETPDPEKPDAWSSNLDHEHLTPKQSRSKVDKESTPRRQFGRSHAPTREKRASSPSAKTTTSSITVKSTISEDLSREDKDQGAKLRYLQRKLQPPTLADWNVGL